MLIVKEIFKRLKEVLNLQKDKELADFFEISQPHIANYKKRGNIPYDKIIEKSIGNYNLEYIFFGKGRALPPKFDLNSSDIDYELIYLITHYANAKLKDELKQKLLKIKEAQES